MVHMQTHYDCILCRIITGTNTSKLSIFLCILTLDTMSMRASRKSKGLRATWKEESMTLAIDALKNKMMGVMKLPEILIQP